MARSRVSGLQRVSEQRKTEEVGEKADWVRAATADAFVGATQHTETYNEHRKEGTASYLGEHAPPTSTLDQVMNVVALVVSDSSAPRTARQTASPARGFIDYWFLVSAVFWQVDGN